MKKKITILFLSLLTVVHAFAQLGVGQQVENNDFELWENTGSTRIEPINWNSLVAQSTNNGLNNLLAGQGRKQVVWQETEVLPPNTTGTSCVKLKAFSVLGIVANGNITTGCINLGSTTASNTKNCSYSKHGDTSLSEAFTARPDYVYFWAKTALSNNNHKARINAVMHDSVVSAGAYNNACYQDPAPSNSSNTNVGTDGPGNEAKVVAKATENFNTSGNWELKQVPFDYDSYASNNAQAQYMLITISTNQNAGTGTSGDLLYIDELVMVYDTRLASLQVNGFTVTGFQEPGNSFPEMIDTATAVLTMNWCTSQPLPTPTFTCQSQNATAEITHAATDEQPYTIITVTQSGVTKNYRINYEYEYAPTIPDSITVCENELPYIWNGQELSEAGTYTDSLQNIYGCDSIVSLNLTITAIGRFVDNEITICEGSVAEWRGMQLTEAGTYYDTIANSDGCIDIHEVSLIVNQNDTVTEDILVCADELPYVWNGQELMEEGTYIDSLQNIYGCDSIVTLNLLIATLGVITEDDILLCEGNVAEWHNIILTEAGTYYDTIANSNGCSNIYEVTVIVNPTHAFDEDTLICESELPYVWRGQELTAAGTYTDSLQNIYGCDSIYTLNLAVIAYGRITDDNIAICEGGVAEWRDMQLTEAGTYYDTIANINGCFDIYEVTVIVNQNYAVTEDVVVCENELPYEWNGQELTEAGTYTDSLQTIFGCDSICTLNLSIALSYDFYAMDTAYMNELYENYGISNIFTDTTTTSFEIRETTTEGCDSVIHLTVVVLNPEGIQDVDLSSRIVIYPNPAKDYMTISANGVQMKEVTLFDNAGRKVYQQTINVDQFTFGVQHLSTGEYVMQIVTDNGLLQKKVIIQ